MPWVSSRWLLLEAQASKNWIEQACLKLFGYRSPQCAAAKPVGRAPMACQRSTSLQQRQLATYWDILAGVQPAWRGKLDQIWGDASGFGPPSTKETWASWKELSRGPTRWWGLEHLPCEKRLGKMGVITLEKGRLWWWANSSPPVSTRRLWRRWHQAIHSGACQEGKG